MYVEALRAFRAILSRTKQELIGVSDKDNISSIPAKLLKWVELKTILLYPKRRRRGAGKVLLRWGLDEADI